MKTYAKRLTSTLLVLMLAVTAFPTSAFAAEETHVHTEDCTHDTISVTTEDVAITSADTAEPITDLSVDTEEVTVSETPVTSGVIGESSVEWNLDTSTGRMVFTGSGDCEPFTSADDQPWAAVRDQITEVWFYDMATLTISNLAHWFDGCSSLVMAEIPYTTPVIGTRAFADCPALLTVMLYYMEETFSITESAFSVSEPVALEVRYVTSSDSTLETLSSYDWHSDNRMAYYTDVYGIMTLATSTCNSCKVTCSYTLEYEQWSDTYHAIRWWCSKCGDDMNQGTNAGVHKMSGGECTLCGYSEDSGGDDTCYHDYTDIDWNGCEWEEYCEDCGEVLDYGIEHGSTYTEWYGCEWEEYCRDCDELMDYGNDHGDSTYTEWSGCDWYEYCDGCDELVDSGTSHGSYSYGTWEYYNSSQHRRLYSCSNCGEGSYSYGYHSTTTDYTSYSDSQHTVSSYCSTCSSSIGSTTYASHSFSYGSWSNYSGSQHRRSKSCYNCGYSTYEYASHSLSYGSWSSNGSSQHTRTVSCSTCSYSTTETGSHNLTYGSWTNYSGTQHRRTVSCSTCSYSTYGYANHSLTNGSWTSISDTQHSRTGSCSCGYSGTETESHTFTYGEWTSVSDNEHQRSVTCDCGYSGMETEDHDLTYGSWTSASESQHSRNMTCDCGYSDTEYEDHALIPSDWTEYSESQHERTITCSCGHIGTEYENHNDNNSDGYCDECDYRMLRFSVTVPAIMNFVISSDGEVYAATNAVIVNNSTYNVEVTSVTVTAGDNWTLVPYDYNMADVKVNSRMIGFSINGAETSTIGNSEKLSMPYYWAIDRDESLPLEYDAVISATSEIYAEEQVLTVVFILNWGPR